MKVITGSARGQSLATLKGDEVVRPTSQMIKEVMFSAVQFEIGGARVLDLFAGSGQLGIEALSRGAAQCLFLDIDRDACAVIKENLKKTKLFGQARVVTGEAKRYLMYLKERFDLVFIDPPYKKGMVAEMLPLLDQAVSPAGVVFCETEAACELPDTVGGLQLKKKYKHGYTTVWLYRNTLDPLMDEEDV